MQQSQAKDFADRVKYLTRDTAIGKQRMPENQRENAEEKSTPSSSSGNQSGKGHRANKSEIYSKVVETRGVGTLSRLSAGTGLRRSPAARPPPRPPCVTLRRVAVSLRPWTVTRSSLRVLRRVATLCRPLRPVFLLVSFSCSQGPVVGVLGWCWLVWGSFLGHCCPLPSALRSSTTCSAVCPWACGPSGRCFFTGPWTVTRSSLRCCGGLLRSDGCCGPWAPPGAMHAYLWGWGRGRLLVP